MCRSVFYTKRYTISNTKESKPEIRKTIPKITFSHFSALDACAESVDGYIPKTSHSAPPDKIINSVQIIDVISSDFMRFSSCWLYYRCRTRSLISWVRPWFQNWVPM